MPRATTTAELALLQGTSYSVWQQILIEDATGTMQDWATLQGHNFVISWNCNFNIDQTIAQASIVLRREIRDNTGHLSVSPFMDGSPLNAAGPAIDVRRRVQILTATTAVGTAPVSGDWKNIFEGYVTKFDVGGTTAKLTVRDLGDQLTRRFVETETQYGAADGSVVLEDVIQSILTTFSAGPITLYVPTASMFAIKPYKQSIASLSDAVDALDGLNGWDTRYVWDAGTSAWRYTLYQPPRGKTIADRILDKSRILAVNELSLSGDNVRNAIECGYTRSDTGVRDTATATDATSIARYDRGWLRTDEPSDSPIDTPTEAQAFVDLILSDTKDPLADQSIEMHFDWSIELHDLEQFNANFLQYDTDQKFAVVDLTHSYANGKYRTVIATRGTVCGRYQRWIARGNNPRSAPSSAGPTLQVNAVTDADSVTISVQNTGLLTLSTDGGLTFGTSGLPAAFPWVVARPDSTAGLAPLRYVFDASLNGQHTQREVYIPATDAPAIPKTPPDHTYVTAIAVSDTVTVHDGAADLIVLSAMPAARTASLHPGHQFGLDCSPFGSAKLIASVPSVAGSSGSKLALEYWTGSAWANAGATDITVAIDATGTHIGTVENLVAGVTGDTLLRIVTVGGDGATSPEVGYIDVSFTEALPVDAPPPVVVPPTKLFLRNTVPSSAPAGSTFPRSSSMPVDNVRLSTNYDTPRGMVQTKGSETSTGAWHLAYVGSSVTGTHDGFAAVFLSEPFTAGQTIPAGDWEFGGVGVKWFTPGVGISNLAIYVLRLSGGVWSKVGTIYDVHEGNTGAQNLIFASRRVIKKVVAGASLAVLTGDVLAFEPWMHVERAPGSLLFGTPDALADIYHDGATDIPFAATDGGTFDAIASTIAASYLLAPCALNVP